MIAVAAKPCRAIDREQSLHVDRVRAPFQSVQQDEAEAIVANRRIEMIEHQLVAVRRGERLAAKLHQPARPRQAAPDRLRVRSAQEPGGCEGRSVNARIPMSPRHDGADDASCATLTNMREKISVAFVPPKPKEFDITCVTFCSRALFGT